jgi:acetoin utilization protein AcuB
MDVRDAMTARPVVVRPDQTVGEAQGLMRDGRFRHLPVLDGTALVGVLSERDLHIGNRGDETARNRPVRGVMSREPITIDPSEPLEQAARLMLENKVGCLPVVEGGALVGIITEADIFRAFVDVLGVMEPGTRVQVRAADLPAALERIADVARGQNVRIVSMVTERPRRDGPANLIVRFGTVMLAPLIAALRDAGLDVADPDAGPTGSVA